jgi:4,5-dihydroxyphthalate decarboxylase
VVLAMGGFRGEGNALDRSSRIRGQESNWGKVKPVFPDVIAEGTRFFKEHGFIPANHTYIIRGDVYRQYPWLALNLFKAFQASKDMALQQLPQRLPSALVFGPQYLEQTRKNLDADPFPYGVKANRAMLETAIEYSYEQGLTKRKLAVEDLFAPVTLDL